MDNVVELRTFTSKQGVEKTIKEKGYHYVECGLDNIFLLNGVEIIKTETGEEIFIHDINGLHKTIGKILVSKPGLLTGKEIRFIRHILDLTQTRLANILGCDYQTILRWEKDKGLISKAADFIIKTLFIAYVSSETGDRNLYEKINEIADLDAREAHELSSMKFEEVAHQWRRIA